MLSPATRPKSRTLRVNYRTSHQIRMPFAYATPPDRGIIVITHGFIKKSPKASPDEITRAWRIFNEDQASAKMGIVRKAKS